MRCGICGDTNFTRHSVLWDKLVDDWQLSPDEAFYIDRQQGEICNGCGSNLRSIALANALRTFLGTQSLLAEIAGTPLTQGISILEINEAGSLSRLLRRFGHHSFGAFPQLDMHAIPYVEGTFDLVVHSDTLEHVPQPVHALTECRRVLKPGGALCFTVPTVVGRMSRSREGLPKSHHGNSQTNTDDYVVHTEFGADAWTFAMRAGFTDLTIHAISYPAATAILARNGWISRN
jgi:SAM-dependent methyltransferase